jgi:hypothetical protein
MFVSRANLLRSLILGGRTNKNVSNETKVDYLYAELYPICGKKRRLCHSDSFFKAG